MHMTKSEELRARLGLSRVEFSKKYDIPIRTLEEWDRGTRVPPKYVLNLLERVVIEDEKNQTDELYSDSDLEEGKEVMITLNGQKYKRTVHSELSEGDAIFGVRQKVLYVVIKHKKYYEYEIDIIKPAK